MSKTPKKNQAEATEAPIEFSITTTIPHSTIVRALRRFIRVWLPSISIVAAGYLGIGILDPVSAVAPKAPIIVTETPGPSASARTTGSQRGQDRGPEAEAIQVSLPDGHVVTCVLITDGGTRAVSCDWGG